MTSSGYCEIPFVKTAFIKPLLNRETETLLPIVSRSPVGLPVEVVSLDFLSIMNASQAPLEARELLQLTPAGSVSAPPSPLQELF